MRSGDLLLTLAVSVPAMILIGFTVFDVVRRPDLRVVRKVGWLALVVLVPVIGTLVYLLARPFPDPAQVPDLGNERTARLIELIGQRENRALSDAEFTEATIRLFGRG